MLDAFLAATGVVAMAEMGDKTQLLSFVLAARLRKPWPILGGILIATLANHALAGSVGYLAASLIPRTAMLWIVGFAFIAFGLWTLHPDSLDDSPRLHQAGAFVTALVAFFVVEMGDKTQLATVALAARFHALWEVVLGTTLGMMLANIPAVWIGDRLATRMPMHAIRITAAVLFILVGALTLLGPAQELL
jgi:putative Ca2+/H+ antiporter (TMEM165/GDT1 family)